MKTALDFSAMDRLRGTDDVRARLMTLMSIGTPSLDELTYAVKIRVKEDYKIVQKVMLKRQSKEKANYDVDSLRDIIGLRLVTLFRLDSLSIVPNLLNLIQTNSGKSEKNLFLADPIEEVVIYSTNPEGDAQQLPQRVKQIFENKGFGSKTRIEATPSNYSSIHVVAWARGKYREGYRNIPIEIQIRTAFEDVWGEIDHKLKYKRVNPQQKNLSFQKSIETSLSHLNVMKTLIDGIAQYGDQIKIQVNQAEKTSQRKILFKLAEEPTHKLTGHSEFKNEIKDAFLTSLGAVRNLVKKLNSADTGVPIEGSFSDAMKAVNSVREILTEQSQASEFVQDAELVLDREEAFLRYTYGKALGSVGGNESLLKARQMFQRLADLHPQDAMVRYRLARTYEGLGDRGSAISQLKTLYENRASFESPPSHWVFYSALNAMCVIKWESVEELRKNAFKHSNDSQSGRYRDVLTSILADLGELYDQEQNFEIQETDKLKLRNNLLYFYVELDKLLKAIPEITAESTEFIEQDVINDCLDKLSLDIQKQKECGEIMSDYRRLDTMLHASVHMQDKENSLQLARDLKNSLTMLGYVNRGGATLEQRMLQYVETILNAPDSENDTTKGKL